MGINSEKTYRIEFRFYEEKNDETKWRSNPEDRGLTFSKANGRKGHYLRHNHAGLLYRIVEEGQP
jgi:hypothetical protein